MKLSPQECLRRLKGIEARLHQADTALRKLRTNDPLRGGLVFDAAKLFAEKERMERILERGGEFGSASHGRDR